MDAVDRKLLNRLQSEFPFAPQPFREIALGLGLSPAEMLARVKTLKEGGVLRQISAIFDSRRLGYQSTLVALRLPFSELDKAGAAVSQHPGVSHNYSRNHIYNLWFTIALPPGQSLEEEVGRLAREAGAQGQLLLPMVRQFKLDARFDLVGEEALASIPSSTKAEAKPVKLSSLEMAAIRELQEDLPLIERPFLDMAGRLGLGEEEFLALGRSLLERGIMRRYSAQLRHRQAGFIANSMGCWIVPQGEEERVGQAMAFFSQVSHCYQRPTYPDWPYNLFTMIHAQSRAGCEKAAHEISGATGITDFILLFSMKEYKKARVKYLLETETLAR
ncbi:MAG: Lrp/AsnC family transcriptional regulator [Chloroflexi bacterium]|nr:Lrp/AsnC family transcriptional regulator [Chloroflexota bacterium]